MSAAIFRFHTTLNDFLPKDKRQVRITVTFNGHETVKHLIESLGAPHTEVDVILINGISVDFSNQLADGDQVDIYPGREIIDGIAIIRLQPVIFGEIRFVLDGHLGKLASYLRLLGFDTLYRNIYDDDELAEISQKDGRVLLTRDRGLLMRNQVRYGYWVRAKFPQKQVVEVLSRYNLADQTQYFSRCARCNGYLNPVEKADVFDRLELKTRLYYHEFRMCQQCNQVYWRGSHFERLEAKLKNFVELSNSAKGVLNHDRIRKA
jgi:uncharacterized protein with PIN domain